MFPGPVFTHELRTVARRPRFYVIRFLCGLILLYFFVTLSWGWGNSNRALTLAELSSVGTGLFKLTLMIQGFTAIFLTPAIVAGTIAEDRQRKILFYLLSSPLSNSEIVLGKLMVRLLYLVILVLVGFPIMSLALLLGGVDPAMLALTEANVLAVIFFLGSLSIFLSSRLTRPRDAIVCAYLCVFAWLMLPAIRALVESELVPIWPRLFGPVERVLAFLADATPFGTLIQGAARGAPSPMAGLYWMMGLNLLFGTALLIPTIRGLRRREQDEGKGRKGWFLGARDRGRGWLRHRPFSLDDPMLWKECLGRFQFRNPALRFVVLALKLVAVAVLATWMLVYAWPAFRETVAFGYSSASDTGHTYRQNFSVGLRFATVCSYILLVLLLAAVSAGSITSEKERDSWISLISTPLEGREILRGKMAGAFWTARYLFAGLLVLWITGVIAGSLHPFGFILLIIATPVYSAFAVALGVHYSSICRTSTRSLVATFATLMVLNGGYLMCCFPIFAMRGFGTSAIPFFVSLSGVTFVVEGLVACSFPEVSGFLGNQTPVDTEGQARLAMVIAYVISVGEYGLATFLLIQNRISSFDVDAERPQRHLGHLRGPVFPRAQPNPSGIVLGDVEETPTDPEGLD